MKRSWLPIATLGSLAIGGALWVCDSSDDAATVPPALDGGSVDLDGSTTQPDGSAVVDATADGPPDDPNDPGPHVIGLHTNGDLGAGSSRTVK